MTVRYNRLIGGVFLLLGGVNLISGIMLTPSSGQPSTSAILAGAFLPLGILFLTRIYFKIEPNAVVFPSMLASVKRTFPYTSLVLENDKIFAEHNGERKRLPLYRWMSHRPDWDAFMQRVRQ